MPISAGVSSPGRFRILLARERECSFIDERLVAARERCGSALVITAPSGMGKSRFLATIAARPASQRCNVVWAQALASTWISSPAKADQYDSSTFRIACAGRASVMETTSAFRAHVAAAVDEAHPNRPALVILDDAQSADESTLRYLADLAPRIADSPVVLLLSLRSEDRPFRPNLAATAARIEGSAAGFALALSELADETLAEAILEATRDHALPDETRAAILVQAAGNPYVAEELLRAWTGRARETREFVPPATVSASIIERARRLTRGTQAILRLCCAIGPAIDAELLAAVANVTPELLEEALGELRTAEFLAQDEPVAFAHELVVEAIAATFLAEEARAIHRRILAALRERNADAVTIARHAILARDREASSLAEHVGDLLAAREEFPEAIPFYEAARGAALAPHGLGPLLVKLAVAYETADEGLRALDAGIEAAHLFAADGELERSLDAAVFALHHARRLNESVAAVAMQDLIDGSLPKASAAVQERLLSRLERSA